MKTIAFIPVRGGSVSIPKKNIKLLAGKPLLHFAIDAADNCLEIDTVVVCTDCEEIKEIALQHTSSKLLVVNRSKEVSTDTSPTIDVVLEFSNSYDYETMVLMQATSPLTSANNISKGLDLLSEGYDSCLSVVREHRFIWNEDTAEPLSFKIPHKPRRQDWSGVLIENGAFYINSKKNIQRDRFYLSGKIGFVEMHPFSALEIDTANDWLLIETLLKHGFEY
ncbi:MAG: acylneuraminate cytidylyltransferase family protein [Brevinema sp.]